MPLILYIPLQNSIVQILLMVWQIFGKQDLWDGGMERRGRLTVNSVIGGRWRSEFNVKKCIKMRGNDTVAAGKRSRAANAVG